jgi:EmrB/QacA subfamily drug resistance transporter
MAQTLTPTPRTAPDDGVLRGRAKNLALTGLFLSMAVSMLSMTVVGTSMPIIIADLGGNQAAFTWVVTATMLASAISTPIWGKLADLTSKKVLLQLSLIIFTVGSALAGIAQDPGWLIAFRVLQGLGAGGLGALGQIVLAEIISPRERGKYMGIMGAIMAVSTVGGPLLGGAITDAIGWRWNFYVAAPIAIVAIIVLQQTLHLHTTKRKVKIDYLGATLISAGFASLLIWVTLGGSQFEWWSWETLAMAGGGVLLLVIAVIVELRVDEPLIPMHLFKNRTFTMSVIASIAVGLAMFGTSVFLGQYMQLARGKTPTESGLLTIPMMAGVLLASTLVGQLISRTGKWKGYMVAGSFIMLAGLVMMGQLRYDTSFWFVGVAMFVLGAGVGMCMQNLVLVVQNTVSPNDRRHGRHVGDGRDALAPGGRLHHGGSRSPREDEPRGAGRRRQAGGRHDPQDRRAHGPDPRRGRIGVRPRHRRRLPGRIPRRHRGDRGDHADPEPPPEHEERRSAARRTRPRGVGRRSRLGSDPLGSKACRITAPPPHRRRTTRLGEPRSPGSSRSSRRSSPRRAPAGCATRRRCTRI